VQALTGRFLPELLTPYHDTRNAEKAKDR